jgi:cupin superfamily acireductone dioxygenase involved in methionine salvage
MLVKHVKRKKKRCDVMSTLGIHDETLEYINTTKRRVNSELDVDMHNNDIVALMCAVCDVDTICKRYNEIKNNINGSTEVSHVDIINFIRKEGLTNNLDKKVIVETINDDDVASYRVVKNINDEIVDVNETNEEDYV